MANERLPSTGHSEYMQAPEKSLTGKTAIVTGGSRDIGAAIVNSLAREGVTVVFSFREKQKRADRVLEQVAGNGGVAHAVQADIATPEGREAFHQAATDILGNRVDYLILGTSGPTEALNRVASNDLLDRFLPNLQAGSVVTRLQSVPGHFDPQLRGAVSMVSAYNAVATHKYDDLQSLRRRQAEMDQRGVRFIEVTPPVVPDTFNMTLFNIQAKKESGTTAEAAHNQISDKLGLPRMVPSAEVGEKIADLLKDPNLKSGHTEFFNGVEDIQTTLEQWYGTQQVYVNTLQRQEEQDGKKRGIGRAIVSMEQAVRPQEPPMVAGLVQPESLQEQYYSAVSITPLHAEGHFRTESGLPSVLPGHKQIRAAVETVGMIEQELGNKTGNVRLAGFDHARFMKTVVADGSVDLFLAVHKKDNGAYDVKILQTTGDNLEETAIIEGLRVKDAQEGEQKTLLEDQLIEGAAQTIGATQLDTINNDSMPLLLEIGKTAFYEGGINAGDGVAYNATTEQVDRRRTGGSVRIESEGKVIGEIEDIHAIVVNKAIAKKLISS